MTVTEQQMSMPYILQALTNQTSDFHFGGQISYKNSNNNKIPLRLQYSIIYSLSPEAFQKF